MRIHSVIALLIASMFVCSPGWAACSPALTQLECWTNALVEQDRVVDAMLVAAQEAQVQDRRADRAAALAARVRFADLLRLHGAAGAAVALLESDAAAAASAPIPVRQDFALALATARAFAGDFDGADVVLSAGLALAEGRAPGLLRLKSFRARLDQVLGKEAAALATHAALEADMRSVFGAGSVDYARYLSDQASMESAADHDAAAVEMAERARTIFEAQRASKGENYRFVLNNLVSYARYRNLDERAAALNRRALPLYQQAVARRLADPTADPDETQRLLRAFARSALAVLWRLRDREQSAPARAAILADALATAAAVAETRTAVRFGERGGGAVALAAERERAAWSTLLAEVARPGASPSQAIARIASFLREMPRPATKEALPDVLDRTLLRRVQSRLGPDEALLVVIPATNDGFTIAVTRDAADWWRNRLSVEEACQAVSKLRRSIVPGPAMSCRNARFQSLNTIVDQQEPFDATSSGKLYRELIAGAGPMLESKRRWHVLTYDSIASLPFGALVVSAPPAELQPWHRINWLGRRHAVTLLPSLEALLDRPGHRLTMAGQRNPAILAVAATCGTAPAQAGCADLAAGGAGSASTAGSRRVEKLVAAGGSGSQLLAGPAATRASVLARAGAADILLFAAHAKPSAAGTALQLGGAAAGRDLLVARDLIGLRLSDPVVMLAACDTSAIIDRTQDDVLRDFGHAFITAGARRLLLTHYAVAEGAAIYLMDRVVEELKAPDRPPLAEALRRATAALMDDPTARHLTDPTAWSGFFAVGAPN